jgi:hypothetical protein
MRVLDLFAGRLGWSQAFLAIGWDVIAIDLVMPDMGIPAGVDYRLQDILALTVADIRAMQVDFICASSPCEQFSVHGMKHFHPDPKFPEMGLRLFNHTRMLCEESGVPYVMENVRAAQKFVGRSVNHCGPFHIWGNAVPACFPKESYSAVKGVAMGSGADTHGITPDQKREYRKQFGMIQTGSKSKARRAYAAAAATIPASVANAVAQGAMNLVHHG